MTNLQKNKEYAKSFSEYLLQNEWCKFVTLTTQYELTLNSARRLAGRFYKNLCTKVFPGCKPKFFWVAERFECKDGYHLHGLLWYSKEWYPEGCNIVEVLDATYQEAAGSGFFIVALIIPGMFNLVQESDEKINPAQIHKFRCSFSEYDTKKAGARYCTKYLLKKYSDYEILY